MRKHLITLLTLLFFASHLHAAETKPVNRIILTSFYPMYITTLNVAQNVSGITVVNMTKPQSGCLHDYQLTPTDMKTLSTAWVMVINGGGMESFMSKAMSSRPNLTIINASKDLQFIMGEGNTGENPHIFVSIAGAIAQTKNIASALSRLDPVNATRYAANCDIYVLKLKTLQQKMHEALAPLSNRSIITFHEAFPYFAQEFNLTVAAVIEREPGSEPSARDLAQTIRIIRASKIKALFAEPQYSLKAAQTIAQETGATIWTLDPAVSGPNSPNAYLQIMESNLVVLRKALL